jgi:hypothetical protein
VETQDDHSSLELEPRLANTDDLVSLCRFLNEAGAKYLGIPFANPQLLWKTKQTHREKDALDRTFLAELLKKKGTKP